MIHVGTAGWSIPAALKVRFPGDGAQLEKYAARLNAVEINSSFYRPHQLKTYRRWAASVPGSFRFSVKLPRSITHERRLRDFSAPLTRFLEEISGLERKLGVILVQLPPSLSFDDGQAEEFFATLRCQAPCAIACELRHASWFSVEAETLLIRHGIARVAADPQRDIRDGVPGGERGLSYYRWHGSPRMYWSAYDAARLASMAGMVRQDSARSIWCIFDNTAAGAALNDALRLMKALGPPSN